MPLGHTDNTCTSLDFHWFVPLRRWNSSPKWRSSPTRAPLCLTAPPPGHGDASLSVGRGIPSAVAHGHAGHLSSIGTAARPPASTRGAPSHCIDYCNTGALGRNDYTEKTFVGTLANRTSPSAAHSFPHHAYRLLVSSPALRYAALNESSPARTHPGGIRQESRPVSAGRLSVLGHAPAAYLFSTGVSQVLSLPPAPPLKDSCLRIARFEFDDTSRDYCGEMFHTALVITPDDIHP